MTVSVKSKLAALGAWLAPSVVAACAGTLVAGLVEVRGELGRALLLVAVLAPLAIPALLAAALVARGLYAAWLPEALAAELREERGSMPRLAAWVGVVWLGLLGLAWAMFQGVWLLARWTAFKVNAVSFLAALLGLLALVVIVALARPAAELFTRIARALDRRWQRRAPGSLLRPPVIFGGAVLATCGVGYLIWTFLIARRLPDLAPGFLLGAIAGVLATIVVHAAWRGPRIARALGGGAIVAGTGIAVALGTIALHDEPRTAIAIWSESRLGRYAIERTLELEELRERLPLEGPGLIERKGPHRDLVLITVDGLRADRTASLGTLGALASRGLAFDWAFAPGPTERRTIPSLVTGLAPHRVRGRATGAGFALDPRHVGFAERLADAGYQAAAFTCCFGDRAQRSWLRGFAHRVTDDDPARLAEATRTWVRARTDPRPLLLWIHLAVPWPADREALAADRRAAAYAEGLAQVDRAIATIVEAFATRSVEASPILAIAGTRGEELGEHGTAFGHDELYNTQLRVPLIFAGPPIRIGHHPEAVSLVDLGPTLVELAGYAPARGTLADGISLAPLLTGGRASLGSFAFAAILPDAGGPPRGTAVIRGNHKLIDGNGTLELYDLKADPDERANLASSRVQVVAELRALLGARLRAPPPF